jgi:hypothetical protein
MDVELPVQVDHINRNKADNRWNNLRGCTPSHNLWNTTKRKVNTSGFKNVHFNKQKGKYQVKITIDKSVRKHIGYFICKEEANIAAITARLKYQGEFAIDNNL